jgi:NAD(P)-dependent dehydrogenase (short-subunit alcohol dehydrogenase family)
VHGKRILVTGAASGVGAALVTLLADRGAHVTAVDRDADGLARLARAAAAVSTITLDLTDSEQIDRALGSLELDGVANVAGAGPDLGDVRRIFAVNLVAPFRVLQAAQANLLDGAAAVNVGSIAGALADDRYADLLADPLDPDLVDRAAADITDAGTAYTYSKWAVVRCSQRLALACAPGLRVNTVSPGLIDTPMGHRSLDLPWTRKLRTRIPADRVGSPTEVASVIAFLLADESAYINGADIPVDGGYAAFSRSRRAGHPAAT